MNVADHAAPPIDRLSVETYDVLIGMVEQIRTKKRRSIRRFVEEEIIVPSGPFEGRRFSCGRNPAISLWFDALDRAAEYGWRRFCATGPQQSGKTLCCFVAPILYHAFELRQTAVIGVPTLDIAADKWQEDLLPAIHATRFRDLLPRTGPGSRGGIVDGRVQFTNGVTLRFMTGGGDDKSRSNFTAQSVMVTETDGMDEAGKASREADPISQLEGRTRAFGERARTYLECTVSIEEGRTWQEYTHGTESRVAIRCPSCRQYVTPERENLVGWKDGKNILEAGELTRVCCPGCGSVWDEDQRIAANRDPVLLHKGQKINERGEIEGQPPRTDTLGFRWNCLNNLLQPMGIVGQEEWRAERDPDEVNAQKRMLQFFWAKPHHGTREDASKVESAKIIARTRPEPRGTVPEDANQITIGVDVGIWTCNWVAIAWRPGASPHALDYDVFDVSARDLGKERGLLTALRNFRDGIAARGWRKKDGSIIHAAVGFVDARYLKEPVYRFCEESRGLFYPSMGYGVGQDSGMFREKKRVDEMTPWIGEAYHLAKIEGCKVLRAEIDVDHWKSWVHGRLETAVDRPGAMTLWQPTRGPNEHLNFAKQLTAEKQVQDYLPGKGQVLRWVIVSRNNHYFDATVLASVCGHMAGQRLLGSEEKPAAKPATPPRVYVSDWIKNG